MAIAGLLAVPAVAQDSSTADGQQIKQWVNDLGDPSFKVRQHANRQLIEQRAAALPDLRQAMLHPNRELRYRAKRLVEFLEQVELIAQIDEFSLADDPSAFQMPLWNEFSELMQDIPFAQMLYADMLRSDLGFFQQLGTASETTLQQLFDEKIEQLQQSILSDNEQLPAEVFSVLFVMQQKQLGVDASHASFLVSAVNDESVIRAATQSEYQTGIQRLIQLALLDNPAIDVTQVMRINLPQVLPRARKLAADRSQSFRLRVEALRPIERFGAAAEVDLLETLFDDATKIRTIPLADDEGKPVEYVLTFGDYALFVAIGITKQSIEDYGVNKSRAYGYSSQEAREKAHETWKSYRAEQPTKSE
jgi:hypothetical protein